MLRVCVIFGGMNSEHEVSLRSVECFLDNIDRTRYEIVMVGITKQGKWLYYTGPEEMIPTGEWQSSSFAQPVILSPDAQAGGLVLFYGAPPASVKLRRTLAGFDGEDFAPPEDTPTVVPVDVVIPVLHGKNGEDGTIQGLLELAGIPYVGSKVLASAACMDKDVAHRMLVQAGINKTKLRAIEDVDYSDLENIMDSLEEEISYPMFVKPANAGSSVGVSKVKNRQELRDGVALAFEHDRKVVVEQAVLGREIECAVMGNGYPVAAYPLGEIIPTREFYDYEGKYEDDSAGLIAPAEIDHDIADKVRAMAIKAYQTMGCNGLARVDFFVESDGTPVLNEINTFPGFTSISMYPRLFELDGVSIPEQINRLIAYALED